MRKLLTANLMRIKKSKLFWSLCGISAAISLYMIVDALANRSTSIDTQLVSFVLIAEIASAIFTSLFLGTEYGDGTIRNKLIVGHGRPSIYLADLITSIIGACAFLVSYMLPIVVIGFPCLGVPAAATVQSAAIGLLTLFAFCALFTMVSMVCANKAGATVINLVLAFLLLLIGFFFWTYLMQPAYVPAYGFDTNIEYLPNPHYVGGAKRVIMQILSNISPGGQAIQLTAGVTGALWPLPLYSIGLCGVCTAVGMTVFYKKDIK